MIIRFLDPSGKPAAQSGREAQPSAWGGMDRQTGVNVLSPLMGAAHFTWNQMKCLGESVAWPLLWHELWCSAGAVSWWIWDTAS